MRERGKLSASFFKARSMLKIRNFINGKTVLQRLARVPYSSNGYQQSM